MWRGDQSTLIATLGAAVPNLNPSPNASPDMRQLLAMLFALSTFGAIPSLSYAQEGGEAQHTLKDPSQGLAPAIGVRVGGYGFRHLNSNANLAWDNCRMNGVGVYGTLDFSRHFFAELSADMYHATGDTLKSGIDRISLHTFGVLGARLAPDFLISPYIHLGGGAEYTWVEVYGHKDQGFMPVGFVGLGGELNLDPFKLGMAIRSHAMQLPVYDWSDDQSVRQVNYRTEIAGQMLFSVRYML